ncbi:hypothetical protein PPL_03041 [Heterostelium album PN500]|uniref:Methyltransferase n=1 Tax=Heterostelium pallidum (strain ATCC 26659 / Pp 5 / PN500) TaxID=670386 RepID=D3B3S1_HETP5|nr:hypothetical protein PPL_03041 [Heterostelium album PN500]EFA83969.1 hypothetical protein PPL_03041 [Heterostelium album PN500]|eukprot:XP_020436086.1 hypothetical protein PPL_03041 [Heterostelium album PN500]
MLNGREKNGQLNINWKEYALGADKFKRKTVGFGKYDKREKEYEKELFIREMSIIQGGIGCAIWDAAIIMSRWIFKHQDAFSGQKCLELGSGVGLTGILAAHFCQSITLTDYLPPLLENLKYNVDLNSRKDTVDMDDDEEIRVNNRMIELKEKVDVKYLNWDEIDSITVSEDEKYDIIFGSELTYSLLSVDNLIKVIQKYLKNDGIFYEILSDDRDGVSYFLEQMQEKKFISKIVPVDQQYLGSYGTKQREETYKFYSFKLDNGQPNNHIDMI